MPKKFAGENSKAAAAKARKAEKAEAENLKKEKEREDAEWRDDDKSLKKKQVGVDKVWDTCARVLLGPES